MDQFHQKKIELKTKKMWGGRILVDIKGEFCGQKG